MQLTQRFKKVNQQVFNKENLNFNNFSSFLVLIFKQNFRNIRTYIFCLFIPIVLFAFCVYIWNLFYADYYLTPPLIIAFSMCGYIFSSIYISIQVYELKIQNFFSRIKVLGISKITIILSYYILSLILSFLVFLIAILGLFVFAKIRNASSLLTITNLKWFVWIEVIMAYGFIIFASLLLFLTFSMVIKKRAYAYLLIFTYGIYALVFSEIILIPEITNISTVLVVLSFFSFFKYCTWVIFILSSYMNFDYWGFTQLFVKNYNNVFVSFWSVWVPISIMLLLSLTFLTLLLAKMRFSDKY